MDADFSHRPSELKKNIKLFKKNKSDLLIASRYLKKSNIPTKGILQKKIPPAAGYFKNSDHVFPAKIVTDCLVFFATKTVTDCFCR